TLLLTLTSRLNAQNRHFNIISKSSLLSLINFDSLAFKQEFLFRITSRTDKLNDILQMDSIITSSSEGKNGIKCLFEYDNNRKIASQLFLGNISGNWVNFELDFYYYDENDNLIQEIILEWNGNDWDSLSRINYSYNNQGKISQYVVQNYEASIWGNYFRDTVTYDTNGNEIIFLNEMWSNNNWYNSFMVESFNSNKRDSLLFKLWANNNWKNFSKTYFYYDSSTGFPDSLVAKMWTEGEWVNYLKRNIENDFNGNQIEQIDQIWNQNEW